MTPTEEEDETLAAEFVVGVLSGEDRRAAERRARVDRDFAARITAWEARLHGLNGDYGSVAPPARVKRRLNRRLFPRPRFWPGFLTGAVTAVLSGLAAIALVEWLTLPSYTLRADLTGDAVFSFTVDVDPTRPALRIVPTADGVPADQVFELWLLRDGAAPQSLGTFADATQVSARGIQGVAAGRQLAVSLEPLGGSPTGAPTGPVVALGMLQDG